MCSKSRNKGMPMEQAAYQHIDGCAPCACGQSQAHDAAKAPGYGVPGTRCRDTCMHVHTCTHTCVNTIAIQLSPSSYLHTRFLLCTTCKQVPHCKATVHARGVSRYFRQQRICALHARADAVDVLGQSVRCVLQLYGGRSPICTLPLTTV